VAQAFGNEAEVAHMPPRDFVRSNAEMFVGKGSETLQHRVDRDFARVDRDFARDERGESLARVGSAAVFCGNRGRLRSWFIRS
jgi:hypothetical protein